MLLTSALLLASAHAGGSPEDVVLVVDPSRQDALEVANHYRHVRGIPHTNLLYLDPVADSAAGFADVQRAALVGELEARGLDHVDYVVVAPARDYRIPASGLIADGCVAVRHLSLSGAWSAFEEIDRILAGTLSSTTENPFELGSSAVAFDAGTAWRRGLPFEGGRRLHLGAYLGHTGTRGNTVPEILDLIDRSAAVDATSPVGTVYFMETTDPARSGPRDPFFPAAIARIVADGGAAVEQQAVLPTGATDALGVMTGAASPAIASTPFTLLPGSFADHLTSFAGHFDTSSQVKMSEWIRKGASATWGAVEEPCNYAGKFPPPNTHPNYAAGLSLGEAVYRSVAYFPFQGLFLGDPLTQPFAAPPTVSLPSMPPGPLAGVVALDATAASPAAGIDTLELFVDGTPAGVVRPGNPLPLDTAAWADGWHALRVRAVDDTPQRHADVATLWAAFDNHPADATLSVPVLAGDTATPFPFTVSPSGGTMTEARIWANGRVVAATRDPAVPASVFGATLGVGLVEVHAEVVFDDGARVLTARETLDVAAGGTSTAAAAAASRTVRLSPAHPSLVWFPGTTDDAATPFDVDVLTGPAQATLTGTGGWRLVHPTPGATGADTVRWAATVAGTPSLPADLDIVWDPCVDGMRLAVPPLLPGARVDFSATCAPPGSEVTLLFSLTEGETYGAPVGVVVGLDAPTFLARATADDTGTATLRVRVPATAPSGAMPLFEAVTHGRTSGVEAGVVP